MSRGAAIEQAKEGINLEPKDIQEAQPEQIDETTLIIILRYKRSRSFGEYSSTMTHAGMARQREERCATPKRTK